jgi:uncharacterized protein (TIGR02466 family)
MITRDEGRVLAARAAGALRAGRREEAAVLAQRALSSGPLRPETLSALSSVALELGDISNAATLMERALAGHRVPAPAAWYVKLGDARSLLGTPDEALISYRQALAIEPEDAACLRGSARALEALHDVPGTIDAWRRVIALARDDWEAQNRLGAALMEVRDWDGAAAAFLAAKTLAPGEPAPIVNRATLDVRRGRAADAVTALGSCVAEHPDYAPAHVGLGFALRELSRFDESAAAFRRGLALSPEDASAACGLSRALLEAGDAPAASEAAREYLKRRPSHAGALAAEALARMSLGDAAEVERLLDHERLVSRVELDVPDGFSDLATFNRALAAHAAAHPTLVESPSSHATTAGMHSGSLLRSPRGPVAAFERALRAAVARYSRALPELAGHPFVAGRPRSAFFNLWCVVMERGAHQTPHIHPSAWLSGVYYPEVPETIRTGDGPDGWLEFGGADRAFPSRLVSRVVRVRPVEGTLVLFPSYFYHRTIPFDAPGRRVSIAFDLVPT